MMEPRLLLASAQVNIYPSVPLSSFPSSSSIDLSLPTLIGLVLLFEGEFAKDKAKLKPPTTLRGAVGDHPVSGLHFMNPPDSGKGEEVILGTNREPVGSPKWLAGNLTATAAANLHKLYVVLDCDGGSENSGGAAAAAAAGGQGGGAEGEAGAGGPMTARGGVLVYNTAELARPVVVDEQVRRKAIAVYVNISPNI